jgi:hypothetical protein
LKGFILMVMVPLQLWQLNVHNGYFYNVGVGFITLLWVISFYLNLHS